MAMSKVWAALVLLSFVFGVINGKLNEVTVAALEGAGAAVTLAISLAGIMCLWTGILEIMNRCGLSTGLARLLRPLLSKIMPEAFNSRESAVAVSANVSANLLGLGNAATPLGIKAAVSMRKSDVATDDLCMFVVINTASIQLIPVTIAGVRAGLGASDPFDILPAVWFTSVLSISAGILAAKILSRFAKESGAQDG